MNYKVTFINIDSTDIQMGDAFNFKFSFHSEESLIKRITAIATDYVHLDAHFFNIIISASAKNSDGPWYDSRDFRIIRNEKDIEDITFRYLKYNDYQQGCTKDFLSKLFLSDEAGAIDRIIELNRLEHEMNCALERRDWETCKTISLLLNQLAQ